VLGPSCGLNENAKMRMGQRWEANIEGEQHTREITEASLVSLVALPAALASCRKERARSASRSVVASMLNYKGLDYQWGLDWDLGCGGLIRKVDGP
jgi:hypothetical protein